MKEIFLLKGLDCPNCAAKIEKTLGEADGVEFAVINLVRQTLSVHYEDKSSEEMLLTVKETVKKFEPDVKVSIYKKEENFGDNESGNIIRLLIGGSLLVLTIVFSQLKIISTVINVILIAVSFLVLGYDVLYRAVKNILKGSIFDENFLMSISTLGAWALGEYAEAAAVMLFYQIGEYFQSKAVRNSRKSITSLMDIRPDYLNLYRDGELIKALPEQALVGDIILIKSGERIPLDCVITEGSSSVDMRALTGESVPKSVTVGDELLSGGINLGGILKARVVKIYSESTASKILEAVENASENKAKSESFITKFARYYTPVVVLFACLLGVLMPLITNGNWSEWIRRSLVFLVISCPCALVISVPLAYFGGIGAAAKAGILVKGGNYLEALIKTKTVVFDKTGTLTKGVFKVTKIIPEKSCSEDKCLSVAVAAESMSNHPIAKSIIEKYGSRADENKITLYNELAGLGVSVVYEGRELLAGNEKLMVEKHIDYCLCEELGTKVYIAENGLYIGCIVISDEIKEDSAKTIRELKKQGIKNTVMLTGDSDEVGSTTAEILKIDKCYTQLLPDKKAEIMQLLKNELSYEEKAIFIGDGINDAPVLANADIGIAMGGIGSDAAIEAADIVIMTDEPSKLLTAFKIAKKARRIVVENIAFALSVKLLFLILGAVGLSGMWLAVFADVGVAVIAVLNSMRALKSKNGI